MPTATPHTRQPRSILGHSDVVSCAPAVRRTVRWHFHLLVMMLGPDRTRAYGLTAAATLKGLGYEDLANMNGGVQRLKSSWPTNRRAPHGHLRS